MNKELCGDYCINLSQLETRSGVYFLYQNEKLVYIGKANNITRRILEHIEEGVKVFNSVRYSIVPIDSLSTVETSLINIEIQRVNGFLISIITIPAWMLLRLLLMGMIE